MNKADTITHKYKVSIVIDIMILMILLSLIFILIAIFRPGLFVYFPMLFIVIIFSYYFLGDKLFINQSIGKKIMKIKVVNQNGDVPKLSQIMQRRLYEFVNYDCKLFKVRIDINEKSKTKIIIEK